MLKTILYFLNFSVYKYADNQNFLAVFFYIVSPRQCDLDEYSSEIRLRAAIRATLKSLTSLTDC